jgi:hypothetical protein
MSEGTIAAVIHARPDFPCVRRAIDNSKGLHERALNVFTKAFAGEFASEPLGAYGPEILPSTAQTIRGRPMTRLRLMILAQSFGILIGMILMGIGAPKILNTLRLADEGKVTVAKVTASKVETCGKRERYPCTIYSLSAEGGQFQLFLPANHALGEEVTIVYSPRDISVVLSQRSSSRWEDLYRRAVDQRDISIALGLGGILTVVASLIALLITLSRNAVPQKPVIS